MCLVYGVSKVCVPYVLEVIAWLVVAIQVTSIDSSLYSLHHAGRAIVRWP